jgi:hypothetical protein
MTKRGLLAAAAFAASAVSAWAANVPPSALRGWYEDGRWLVAESAFADGNEDCMLANTQPASSGETAFVLSEFGGGNSTIMFRDTTITWDASGGSVTFQIDNNPSFTAPAQADVTRNVLIVPLRGTPSTIMRAFMNQFASGRVLLVTASAGTPRTFRLDGVQAALDAFGRCITAMRSTDAQR